MLGCPDCGTLETDKHAPECRWEERHRPSDPLVATHVAPEMIGWTQRSDMGPRVWQLPTGQLFQFTPDASQMIALRGRIVTTIEHDPPIAPPDGPINPAWEGMAILKTEGGVYPNSLDGRDQTKGDWPPPGKSCDLMFPERGHCAQCDEWFDGWFDGPQQWVPA